MEHELPVMVFYLPPRGGYVPPGPVRPPAARRPEAAVKSSGATDPAAPREKGDSRPRPCLALGRRRG